MQVEDFLESAAILRDKLSEVPYPAETIEVLSTYVFYSMILVMLILMALFVRIHWNGMNKVLVQPVTRKPPKLVKFLLALKDKPENINPIEDEVAQKQNVAEVNLKLQDKKEPCTCLVPLAEKSSETKSRPSIPEQQPPLWPKVAAKAVLSPLTLFLLGTECTQMYDPVYEKWLGRKRRQFLNRARGKPMHRKNHARLK